MPLLAPHVKKGRAVDMGISGFFLFSEKAKTNSKHQLFTHVLKPKLLAHKNRMGRMRRTQEQQQRAQKAFVISRQQEQQGTGANRPPLS